MPGSGGVQSLRVLVLRLMVRLGDGDLMQRDHCRTQASLNSRGEEESLPAADCAISALSWFRRSLLSPAGRLLRKYGGANSSSLAERVRMR